MIHPLIHGPFKKKDLCLNPRKKWMNMIRKTKDAVLLWIIRRVAPPLTSRVISTTLCHPRAPLTKYHDKKNPDIT
jgi:hypothetical protein